MAESFENIKFIAFSPFLECAGTENVQNENAQHPLYRELRAYQGREEKEKEEERKKQIKQRKVQCISLFIHFVGDILIVDLHSDFRHFHLYVVQRVISHDFRVSEHSKSVPIH